LKYKRFALYSCWFREYLLCLSVRACRPVFPPHYPELSNHKQPPCRISNQPPPVPGTKKAAPGEGNGLKGASFAHLTGLATRYHNRQRNAPFITASVVPAGSDRNDDGSPPIPLHPPPAAPLSLSLSRQKRIARN
jgi:hypothetical protein